MTFKIPPEGLPSFTDAQGVTTGQGRLGHRLFKRDQSWCYEAIWALCGRKIRVMVTRNAYDQQSFCKAQSFDEVSSEWKFLCEVPFEKARHCYGVNWTNAEADQSRFEQDADDVIEKVCRILNPFYASIVGAPCDGAAQATPGALELKGLVAPYVTKVELIARIYFSDGSIVDREVDK